MNKLFIDSSDISEIKRLQLMGSIDGCTTNPKILAEEDVEEFEQHMKKVLDLVEGPVSIEVTSNEFDEMVEQAHRFDSWGENAVVKLPMTQEGLSATKEVSDEGIDVNVTACMSADQVLMASKAGARFASIFMGRVGDMGFDAEEVISNASELIEEEETEICIGSIRKAYDVQRAFLAGADVVTIRPKFFDQLIHNPRTESSINEFLDRWEDV